MKGKKTLYIVIFVIILVVTTLLPTNAIQNIINKKKIKPLSGKLIAIDPGHGGN